MNGVQCSPDLQNLVLCCIVFCVQRRQSGGKQLPKMAPAVHVGLFAITAFLLYLAFRTAVLKASVQYPSQRALEKNFPISIHEGLAEAIRFATISYDAHSGRQLNHTAFEGLRKFIFKRK